MKIRLLKDLPGAKAGTIYTAKEKRPNIDQEEIGNGWYTISDLIDLGFAEEIKEEPKSVWDLKYDSNENIYYIDMTGNIGSTIIRHMLCFHDIRKQGNIFLTKEEAEMELLRRESRAKAWKPSEGERYYYKWYDSFSEAKWIGNTMDFMFYYNGNCHKTQGEAREWTRKYGKAFNIN